MLLRSRARRWSAAAIIGISVGCLPLTAAMTAHASITIHHKSRVGRFSLPAEMSCKYKDHELDSFSWTVTPRAAMSRLRAAQGVSHQYIALYVREVDKVAGQWKLGQYVAFRLNAPRGNRSPPLKSFSRADVRPPGGRPHANATAERLDIEIVWFKPGEIGDVVDGYVSDKIMRYRNNVTSGVHSSCPVHYYDPSWTKLGTTQGPPAATNTATAFDLSTNSMLLFGGRDVSGNDRNETWVWNGGAWTQLHPAQAPGPRQDAAMAYDDPAESIVMFGGFTGAGADLGDTWTWTPQGWTAMTTSTAPSPRDASGQVAFDDQTGQVVLFGGQTSSGTALSDTWIWDGRAWSQMKPTNHPPAGAFGAMTYDATSQQLLFLDQGQTWTWTGSQWLQLHPRHSPSIRFGASIAFDPRSHRVILFGGNGAQQTLGDMWSWDGVDWNHLDPEFAPSPRESAALMFIPNSNALYLYGGDNGEPYTDAWTWAH